MNSGALILGFAHLFAEKLCFSDQIPLISRLRRGFLLRARETGGIAAVLGLISPGKAELFRK